ncbi:MAG: cytochrome c oxidase assembly protein [Thermomicrobiales bacterium]|nr:cytochrome c oxidase assembly protein [Thermomicrobiales bacterium]
MLSKLPLLHFDGNYPEGRWHSHWQMDPQILLLGFVLIAGYLALIGPINERYPGHESRTATRKQIWCFLSGVIIMVLVLGPPFHDWADYFLLSAHMAQHLVLMLLVAPLLLLGLPVWFFDPITNRPWLDRIGGFVFQPVVSFAAGNFIMVLWHLPPLYNAALYNDYLHGLQHMSFLVSGILVWWTIIAPNPRWHKATPLVAGLLLFANTIPGAAVGAVITLANSGVYEFYNDAPRLWNFSLRDDQELAGAMMWMIVPFAYLAVLTVIFLRYAAREEAKDLATPAKRREVPSAPVPPAEHPGV